nr:hypothetical protein [uncultured Pseudomonas sp.]
MHYARFANGNIWPIEGSTLTAYVGMGIAEVHDFDEHNLRDQVHQAAVGTFALRRVQCTVAWGNLKEIVFRLQGWIDWSAFPVRPEEVWQIREVVEHYGQLFGWSLDEQMHALKAHGAPAPAEDIVMLGSGRELRTPAVPSVSSYARVCQFGFELARLDVPADEIGLGLHGLVRACTVSG